MNTPIVLGHAEGTASLERGGYTFEEARQRWKTGDYMKVIDNLGADEEVVIFGAGSKRTVRRLVLQGETASLTRSYFLADVDADDKKRLLTLYKMFDGK